MENIKGAILLFVAPLALLWMIATPFIIFQALLFERGPFTQRLMLSAIILAVAYVSHLICKWVDSK